MNINRKISQIIKYCKAFALLACIVLLFPLISYSQITPIPDPAFRDFLIKKYPNIMDPSGQLMVKNAATVTGVLDCSGMNIKDLTGIQFFKGVTEINCSNNQLNFLPPLELATTSVLRSLNCSNNKLTALPPFNVYSQSLKKIDCSNNLITDVSETYLFLKLDSLICNNNKLTFEDLTPIVNKVPHFKYAPQSEVVVATKVQLREGEIYTFKFPVDDTVSNCRYKSCKMSNGGKIWYGMTSNSYEIPSIKITDGGVYWLYLYNSLLPDLYLVTSGQELVVEGNGNAANVFTPNGDNKDDSYEILCTGTIRIYNKHGQQIKELQGPNLWDGTDQSGSEVPLGAYIIRCSDSSENIVTLVR